MVRNLIQFVCAELRSDNKPILLSGLGRPFEIVLGAMEGIREFECAWPFTLAQAGIAMSLPVPSQFPDCSPPSEIDLDLEYQEDRLNLTEAQFEKDVGPICPGCQCYACRRHSRAYVHHLVACEELTGTALLTL